MRAALLLTCLWPGLASLWWRGERAGVAVAVAFSAWLNLALAAKFVWPELLSPLFASLVWGLLLLFWVAGICHSASRLSKMFGGDGSVENDRLFLRAQAEYLQGNWYEAETLLNNLLDRQPRDIEGRLLLATLLRHTRRIPEAREQLKALGRYDGAARWMVEIHREARLLSRIAEESLRSDEPASDTQPASQAA